MVLTITNPTTTSHEQHRWYPPVPHFRITINVQMLTPLTPHMFHHMHAGVCTAPDATITNPTHLSQPTLLIHRPRLCVSVIHVDPPATSWTWVCLHIVSVYRGLSCKPSCFNRAFLQFKGVVVYILTGIYLIQSFSG